jgi:hypothetical protein
MGFAWLLFSRQAARLGDFSFQSLKRISAYFVLSPPRNYGAHFEGAAYY